MATVHAAKMGERTECIREDCTAKPSDMIETALCDRHAISAYRAVAKLLSDTPTALVDMLAGGQPARVLGKAQPRTDRTRRNVRTAPGIIYFAKAGDLVKIGYTTNLRQRMAQLGHDVIATQPGTMMDEQALHHRFGEHWDHGEYFRPGASLMEYIDTLGDDLQISAV